MRPPARAIKRKTHWTPNWSALQLAQKWLVVSLLITAVGGHWAILQGVAWAQMLVRYSHGTSLEQGFSKTFSGKHPCKLCKLVQEGRAKEQKQETQKPTKEIEKSLPAGRVRALYPPGISRPLFSAPGQADSRDEPPPVPPPERA